MSRTYGKTTHKKQGQWASCEVFQQPCSMPHAKKKGKKKKKLKAPGTAAPDSPAAGVDEVKQEEQASAPPAPADAESEPMVPDGPEMLECARYGEDENVQWYLKAGTPVDFAVSGCQRSQTSKCLEHDVQDQGGSTALHKAAANGMFLDAPRDFFVAVLKM